MATSYYLGIDQGTTGCTAILFDESWKPAAKGYREIKQIYPKAGWVEHEPSDVWNSILGSVMETTSKVNAPTVNIRCIGIDHEGESVIAWDKCTGIPVCNAIVWQDRRTASLADTINEEYSKTIREKTGLKSDAYFSATKLKWILDNVPAAREKLKAGRLMAGTMDSWIVWKMTHGKAYVTDASTASRTMLFNIHDGTWDNDIINMLSLDSSMLPEICDSAHVFGQTDPLDFLGIDAPITAIMTDQQAALLGQACTKPGTIKTTYGTGCFMLMNTGDNPVYSDSGVLTTVAWQLEGKRTYALDGGVYITGAATQWLRDGLKIIQTAAETEKMAQSLRDNGGVYFVPAFTGLAAPHWDSYARGMIIGITGGTTREHIARATLESNAYQVKDVLDIMEKDSKVPITLMCCDGGGTANNFLMQFQSDILGIPIDIPEVSETTALGTAYMAALGIGDFSSIHDVDNNWKLARHFEPQMGEDQRQQLLHNWHRAVERAKNWEEI